jgi:hypothetical protein
VYVLGPLLAAKLTEAAVAVRLRAATANERYLNETRTA